MRVLLDENPPRALAAALPGHHVSSVQAEGWSAPKNGASLRHAGEYCDARLSMDRGFPHQENLSDLGVRILSIRAPPNHTVHLQPLVDSNLPMLAAVSPAQLRQIWPERPSTRILNANGPTTIGETSAERVTPSRGSPANPAIAGRTQARATSSDDQRRLAFSTTEGPETMKLVKARVGDFKSIDDSDEFTLDQVTCLVGKNEAGKTAVLEALYKLNPVEDGTGEFSLEEYPRRRLARDRKRIADEPVTVVRTQWELEDHDVQRLEEQFGEGVLKSTMIEISKGYSNKQYWTIPLDEIRLVQTIVAGANLNAAERAPLATQQSVKDLLATLSEMGSPTPKHQALLEETQGTFPDADAQASVRNAIVTLLPKFVYFDVYSQLPGRVALDDLKRQIAKHGDTSVQFRYRIFLALLAMTGTSLSDLGVFRRICG